MRSRSTEDRVEVDRPRLPQRRRRAREPLLLRARLHGGRPRLRRGRRRARRRGARLRAAARPRRSGARSSRACARRWRRWRPPSTDIRPRELDVVGVTGTNGKTTTAFLVRDMLEAAGRQTGLLGTVQSVVGGQVEPVERTTPEAIDLQRDVPAHGRRRRCGLRDGGVVARARAASRGRDRLRLRGVHQPDSGPSRLPRHAGRVLRGQANAVRSAAGNPPRAAAINVDDPWGRRLAQELIDLGVTRTVTFGARRASRLPGRARSLRGRRVRLRLHGRRAGDRDQPSADRALQRLQRARARSRPARRSESTSTRSPAALAGAGQVPGRFEPVDEGQPFTVLVDYAHTPDSLANVLEAARELLEQSEHGDGRLICVFGAGGDRDRDKRPLMGAAARRLADHVIVTSDNPRSEDPDAIIAAIVEGAEQVPASERGSSLDVEPDRRAAIAARAGRRGAARHRPDRGQGPRAGPGARGRPQDPVRRPRGRARAASSFAGPLERPAGSLTRRS